jgi:hypothetical protein
MHLVGSFYEIYITMHGSMNIKFKKTIWFFVCDYKVTPIFQIMKSGNFQSYIQVQGRFWHRQIAKKI